MNVLISRYGVALLDFLVIVNFGRFLNLSLRAHVNDVNELGPNVRHMLLNIFVHLV